METQFRPFRFQHAGELEAAIAVQKLHIPLAATSAALTTTVQVGGHVLPNRMAVHPMEGCDGNEDGSLGELTIRRYKRFAAGGAGLLWFEAVAVVPEGRANPRHLWIHEQNVGAFKQVITDIRATARESMGAEHRPLTIMQLTHAGRFSRPVDKPHPIIACHNHVLGINLKGTFFLTQLVANRMVDWVAEGRLQEPRIITVSSVSAYANSLNRAEYCLSKAGLAMMTQLFAERLAEYGIYVYEIRPGIIATDMTSGVKEKYDRMIEGGLTPIKRWGQPEDVAKAVLALCSELFTFSTGDVLNVDGGFHIRRL